MTSWTDRLSPQPAGGVCIGLPYCFKYCLLRVLDVGGAHASAAKANSSSFELVREATSSSVSLVQIPTTLLEDTLTLTLDFLLVTVVHYWLLIMSGLTHFVSPQEVGT